MLTYRTVGWAWFLSISILLSPPFTAFAAVQETNFFCPVQKPSDQDKAKKLRRAWFNEEEPIRVEVGEPSVWSLEQAHYLLNRMHDVSDSLKAKFPEPDSLDPNAVNGSRIEILRTLFSAAAEVNEPLKAKNEALLDNNRAVVSRRTDLQSRLDINRDRLDQLIVQLGQLQQEKASLAADASATDATKQAVDAQISKAQAEKDAVTAQITNINEELKTLQIDKGFEGPQFTGNTRPNLSDFKDLVEKTGQRENPKLSASTYLDNFIQMQYEIIVKQLSLLRDEVGPGRRVVFLELPVSLDVTGSQRANDHLVRVQWRTNEVCPHNDEFEERLVKIRSWRRTFMRFTELLSEDWRANKTINSGQLIPAQLAKLEELMFSNDKAMLGRTLSQDRSERLENLSNENQENLRDILERADLQQLKVLLKLDDTGNLALENWLNASGKIPDYYTNETARLYRLTHGSSIDPADLLALIHEAELLWDCKPSEENCQAPAHSFEDVVRACNGGTDWMDLTADKDLKTLLEQVDYKRPSYNHAELWVPQRLDPLITTVDLIPRQSALNVNQTYDRAKAWSVFLSFLGLSGGATAQYQRQHQLFEQFVHQDTFASSFGKGTSSFGWTFGPVPGTRQIAPGGRTTFAVLVVPDDVAAFRIEPRSFVYSRKNFPDCDQPADEKEKSFIIPVPTAGEGFFITDVDYIPVEPGQKATVFIRAEDVSPQVGVLVNGVPLKRAVAITRPGFGAEPRSPQSSPDPTDKVRGEYELINSQKILLNFSLDQSYEGTPIISLVTPQRTSPINKFRVTVNGSEDTTLEDHSKVQPIFLRPLKVSGLEVVDSATSEPDEDRKTKCAEKESTNQAKSCKYLDITGQGFKQGAEIWISGKCVEGEQLSTTRFRVRYCLDREKSSEIPITIKQSNRQDQEEVTFLVSNPLALKLAKYDVIKVSSAPKGKPRNIDVRMQFAGGGTEQLCVSEVGSSETCRKYNQGCGGTSKLQICPFSTTDVVLKNLEIPANGDPLALKLRDGDRAGVSTLALITIPHRPTILSIVGPDGAKGLVTGNYTVRIIGQDLRNVTRVLFGPSLATIQSIRDSEIVVVAPPGTAGANAVRLQTNTVFLGRELDNEADLGEGKKAYFEYTPEPKK
jgi:hypothetical protein